MNFVHYNTTNKILYRYHITREMRACESVEDAENKIVTLLQDKFLHLLADFRYMITRQCTPCNDCIAILYTENFIS